MLHRHMLILKHHDMFTDCTAGNNGDFLRNTIPARITSLGGKKSDKISSPPKKPKPNKNPKLANFHG